MSEDCRNEQVVLTHEQVAAKILQRRADERHVWVTTIGGVVCGLAGLVFAFTALLRFENVTMSVLGFLVSAVGFGVMTPTQVLKYLPWRSK